VDLGVLIVDRSRVQALVAQELTRNHSILLKQIYNKRNCDKVFFSWCQQAGRTSWQFPFIDIFYYDTNSTHVWLLGKPSSYPVHHKDVYPLVLRPLGSLWLWSPREPMAHFESRRMQSIETSCVAFPYSHKYEKLIWKRMRKADCNQLRSIYPYVKRICTKSKCTEYLKLGEKTVIHEVTLDVYRTTFGSSNRHSVTHMSVIFLISFFLLF
jgi:hypothetical protein